FIVIMIIGCIVTYQYFSPVRFGYSADFTEGIIPRFYFQYNNCSSFAGFHKLGIFDQQFIDNDYPCINSRSIQNGQDFQFVLNSHTYQLEYMLVLQDKY